MSFFTLDTFQQYHEEVEAEMKAKTESSPESTPSSGKSNGKLQEKRPTSPSKAANTRPLSAQAVSELDPLSALNLARAADPWLGNSLLTPTACSFLDSAEGATASAVAATSLKVVAVDNEEDWGDFHFAPHEEKQVGGSDSDNGSDSNNTEPIMRNNHPRLDIIRSGASLTVSSPSMLLRNNTPTHAALNRQTFPSTRNGESKGFAATLLDRLLSLGNSSPRLNAASANRDVATKRNYDSYDVTFDHGPVGLDLETDWYGRQAVVKGFRAVNSAGDEGPAKRCGMIRVGDVLTAINGNSCLEMNFQETLEALRMAGKSRHTLHFKSLEAAGDLSIYASDKDIVQARAFIHQHKQRFYRAPRAVEGANPHELVLGCIERLRGEFVTALNFHREETGEFLLAASCASDGSGPFIFHTLRDSHLRTMRELPQSEDSAVYLGRLEPSFLGTEFTLFDHHTDTSKQHDNELAFLVYSANVLGRVPNSLKCVVSKPVEDTDEDDLETPKSPSALGQQRSGMGSDGAIFNTHRARLGRNAGLSDRFNRQQQSRSMSITERLRSFTLDDLDLRLEMATDGAIGWLDDDDADGHARSMRVKQARLRGERTASMGEIPYGAVEQEEFEKDLLVFETKQPSWNEELGAWTLNFQGRVKVASKKNFLLVGNDTNEHGDEVEITALRFGKVSKTRFTLDYAAPLAPIQALSVACSAFANKRAVT
ncbi:Tubby-like F-box protein 3 [Phytophthora citrophthora]|uniref:Tubby-like F-box protein 3 n=1 Tax=Phytophthora citrophthora TaxID=4793 RepID=A0AAD9G279_9STRA|nr:Tubby-like F-box protein 3 [Phytophthora citrophthora]